MSVVTQHPPASVLMDSKSGASDPEVSAAPVCTYLVDRTRPPPSALRLIPAVNEAEDAERWRAVETAILDDVSKHHVEFYNHHTKAYTPNYAIHAAFALYRINASASEIASRYRMEGKMLDSLHKKKHIQVTESNFITCLGQGVSTYVPLLTFFTQEMTKIADTEALVKKYIGILVDGIGGDVLHPLVHLGMGLEMKHPVIVVEALAYLSYSHKPLIKELTPPVEDDYDVANILEILQDIREDKQFDSVCAEWASMEYHHRIEKLRADSKLCQSLADLAAQWKFDSDSELGIKMAMEQLADTVVLSFATSGRVYPAKFDFPLAHILIASYALHQTLPLCRDLHDKSRILRRFLLTFLAVYVSQGRPNVHPERLENAYPRRRSSVAARLESASSPPNSSILSPHSSILNLDISAPPSGMEREQEESDEEDANIPSDAYLPLSEARISQEWVRLCTTDDVHCHEAVVALYNFNKVYGCKGGLYMKAAKILRNAEARSGIGCEWDYRGCGYPESSSFQLTE